MIDVKILEAAKQEVADTLFLKSEKLKSLPLQEQYEFDIDITKLPPHQTNAKRGSKYYYEGLKIMGLEPILNEKRGAVYVFHLPENPDRDEYVKPIINCKKSIGRNAPSVENIMKGILKFYMLEASNPTFIPGSSNIWAMALKTPLHFSLFTGHQISFQKSK